MFRLSNIFQSILIFLMVIVASNNVKAQEFEKEIAPKAFEKFIPDSNNYVYRIYTSFYKNGSLAYERKDSCLKSEYIDQKNNAFRGYKRGYYENGNINYYHSLFKEQIILEQGFFYEGGIEYESYSKDGKQVYYKEYFPSGKISKYKTVLNSDTAISIDDNFDEKGRPTFRTVELKGKNNYKLYNWDTTATLTRYIYKNDSAKTKKGARLIHIGLSYNKSKIVARSETKIIHDSLIKVYRQYYDNGKTLMLIIEKESVKKGSAKKVSAKKYFENGQLEIEAEYVRASGEAIKIINGNRKVYDKKNKLIVQHNLAGSIVLDGNPLFWAEKDFELNE